MRTMIRGFLYVIGPMAFAVPAMAQSPGIMGGMNANSAIQKPAKNNAPAMQPPAAVPGARARPDSVAPASHTAADLAPNDALFDAINRGDINAARDAINRGADLGGTNVLGLTPLELSVDLSRNDITFLLLSMRGADDGSGGQSAAPQTASAAAPPAPAGRKRGQHIEVQQPVTGVAARESAPPPHQTVALYAGNGGSPVPSVGFLGFDPHH
jgi:hypothetical protein